MLKEKQSFDNRFFSANMQTKTAQYNIDQNIQGERNKKRQYLPKLDALKSLDTKMAAPLRKN